MTKKRIQIDAVVIAVLAVSLIFLAVIFPKLFMKSKFMNEAFELISFCLLICGILFRMTARGYKKEFSANSNKLVTGGPYQLIRNPMYLGTYLIGFGLLFIMFPWWALVAYTLVFYFRFIKEIKKEEVFLSEMFKGQYQDYCAQVPRLIPSLKSLNSLKLNEIFPLQYAFSTQEKQNLIYIPIVAFILQVIQSRLVFGYIDYVVESIIFSAEIFILILILFSLRIPQQFSVSK